MTLAQDGLMSEHPTAVHTLLSTMHDTPYSISCPANFRAVDSIGVKAQHVVTKGSLEVTRITGQTHFLGIAACH